MENQCLEYLLQRFYSAMRLRNDSVFTEIFLNRIKRNRFVFARFSSVWTGPHSSFLPGEGVVVVACIDQLQRKKWGRGGMELRLFIACPSLCIQTLGGLGGRGCWLNRSNRGGGI